ncbi:MAG: 3-deoxy-8-phosphooctulonate synthase [Acidobacteriota bacterium]
MAGTAPFTTHKPMRDVTVAGIAFGRGRTMPLIAGPCVIEDDALMMRTAETVKEITARLGIPWIFKSSFEKDNRGMPSGYRGPGIDEGLKLLQKVKTTFDVPVLSDVHRAEDVRAAAEVLDVIQIPAFLCQQTSLLYTAGAAGRVVNVKKGQFLAPENMDSAVAKLEHAGCQQILLTERGTTFGYNKLVTDFMGIRVMQDLGYPVVADTTHMVRIYGIRSDDPRGGTPVHVPALSRAAAAAGCNGMFIETHPDPPRARCDAASQFPLDRLEDLLAEVKAIADLMRSFGEA